MSKKPEPREALPARRVVTGRLAVVARHTPAPRICLDNRFSDLVSLSIEAIARGTQNVFMRGNSLVEVRPWSASERDQGGPIHAIGRHRFRDLCSTCAVYYKETKHGEREVTPPIEIADTALARPSLPFSQLAGVIASPVMRPDGSILASPGYDASTCLFLRCAPDSGFEINPDVTREEAVDALGELLELLVDFPYLAPCDRSAHVSMILTAVQRVVLDEPVPLFIVDSPTPGTGKGLACDCAAIVAHGRGMRRTVYSGSDAEMRKVITSAGLAGASEMLFDNVAEPFGGTAIDAAITASASSKWHDRQLGGNQMVDLDLRILFVVSGNNLTLRGDLARRSVLITLQSDAERPDQRSFRWPDLESEVRRRRAQLARAALKIMRAYVCAGRPLAGRVSSAGSFRQWSRMVREPLIWLGLADPLEGQQRLTSQRDPVVSAMGDLIEVIEVLFGPTGWTARELTELALNADRSRHSDHQQLAGCLYALEIDGDRGEFNTRRLGKLLARFTRRTIAGRQIQAMVDDRGRPSKSAKGKLYRVTSVGADA